MLAAYLTYVKCTLLYSNLNQGWLLCGLGILGTYSSGKQGRSGEAAGLQQLLPVLPPSRDLGVPQEWI